MSLQLSVRRTLLNSVNIFTIIKDFKQSSYNLELNVIFILIQVIKIIF